MNYPLGTTHVLLADPLAYCQRPDFLKYAVDFYGPESGDPFYAWYFWTANKYYCGWVKDTATLYSDLQAKGRVVKINDYIAQNVVQNSEP